jgi:hypothetical protein
MSLPLELQEVWPAELERQAATPKMKEAVAGARPGEPEVQQL